MLKIGIIGNSFKENEKRLPIHPADFKFIDKKYRDYIYIDKNYGQNFGYSDSDLKPFVCDILDKDDVYKICDVLLILKYSYDDYVNARPNTICWGWHHLMQNKKNVDIIVQKKLTIISIEEMYIDMKYILEENRIIAGYSSVMHALQLKGITGYLNYNNQPNIAVLSYGSVGKGAVDGLLALNMRNIDVYTKRDPIYVTEKRSNVNFKKYPNNNDWYNILDNYDIIINCVLQDPMNPIYYINLEDLNKREKKLFIIDISCDKNMGFDFATITTFDNPIIRISSNTEYYGVDHSPSVYYNTITKNISSKIIIYIYDIISNNISDNMTLKNAIEINEGNVLNNDINIYQKRL